MPLVTQEDKDKADFEKAAAVWLQVYCAAVAGRALTAEQLADEGLRIYQRKFG